jgi:hypothetical protein
VGSATAWPSKTKIKVGALTLAGCLVLAACTIVVGPQNGARHTTRSSGPSTSGGTTTAGLRHVHDPGHVTGTLKGPCHTRDGGSLPDPSCTPGSFDPAMTAAVLCSSSYSTSSYRPPESQTEDAKWKVVEPAYGQHDVSGELDHLVSLELGGSNDLSNLWVEAGSIPNPKDSVENALHRWVCSGGSASIRQQRLADAQKAIASDWKTALANLKVST